MVKTFIFLTLGFLISSCGVKGDPLPPEIPPEIGRGKPGYERATEQIQYTDDEEDDGAEDNDE